MAKPFIIKKDEIIPKGFNYANKLPGGSVIESLEIEAIELAGQTDVTSQVLLTGSDGVDGVVVQAQFQWVGALAGKRVLLRFISTLDTGAKLVEEQIMEFKSFPGIS